MANGVIVPILVLAGALATLVSGEPVRSCRPRRFAYLIADSEQCDKYYRCEDGNLTEQLCPDGLVYQIDGEGCFMPQWVRCGERKRLQQARGNAMCPRLNGRYAIDKECHAYRECANGVATRVNCPPGLVFDLQQAVCEFPDIANRTGCSAEDLLGFRCPFASSVDSEHVVLRFGDHDRLPKPGDCRYFYMCLKSGKPRLGGCPMGKVFNPKTSVCDLPENVPGCEDFYKAKPKE